MLVLLAWCTIVYDSYHTIYPVYNIRLFYIQDHKTTIDTIKFFFVKLKKDKIKKWSI